MAPGHAAQDVSVLPQGPGKLSLSQSCFQEQESEDKSSRRGLGHSTGDCPQCHFCQRRGSPAKSGRLCLACVVLFVIVSLALLTDSQSFKMERFGTSLVVQWLRLHAPNAGGMGSIPGLGTKILRAPRHSKEKKKKFF